MSVFRSALWGCLLALVVSGGETAVAGDAG